MALVVKIRGVVWRNMRIFWIFIKSLARAKKLRAKFEKWESEENSRNLEESSRMSKVEQFEGHVLEEQSIEKAKNLRAIFEQPHLLEQKPKRKEVQVKRFVVSFIQLQ